MSFTNGSIEWQDAQELTVLVSSRITVVVAVKESMGRTSNPIRSSQCKAARPIRRCKISSTTTNSMIATAADQNATLRMTSVVFNPGSSLPAQAVDGPAK